MKKFEIPVFYRSGLITKIKRLRESNDKRKKDYTPTELNFGPVSFLLARHFGFCYGVENAIEISYRALEENKDKNIYLLSEMIHNPEVNNDLVSRGVKFITDTGGKQIIEWDNLKKDDIVIIPAFGTTVEIQKKLTELGLETLKYDTTCPFVEKVWNRAAGLGKSGFSVIVHGKQKHEETRATFSHSKENAPTLIVRNLEETKKLGDYILGILEKENFLKIFGDKISTGFDPEKHLDKIGVVNQTTMLATETEEIAEYLRNIMIKKFGEENIKLHFADTRDTLCYATHDNQRATMALLEESADVAIVVGGYNSSNTSHIVELCEQKLPTFFISSEEKIISADSVLHYDFHEGKEKVTKKYIPDLNNARIMLTSGASCPDSIVEGVLLKILSYYENKKSVDEVIAEIEYKYPQK